MPEYLITARVRDEDKTISVRSISRDTAIRFLNIFTRYDFYLDPKVEFKGRAYTTDELELLP